MTQQTGIDIVFPESSRLFVDLQSNGDYYIYERPPYVEVVEEWVESLQPATCLELGAGLGRMSVYFFKKFGWSETFFYLQDGDSGEVQHGGIRYDQEGEFYNAFAATEEYCEANGLVKFGTVNDLGGVSRPVNFCYSFASIGFHWHISLYLDQLTAILADNAHVMFEIRAPIADTDEASDEKRAEYQRFYNDQIAYAQQHSDFEVVRVVDLTGYTGYRYKDRTHFLILRKA